MSIKGQRIDNFLKELGSSAPTPGGGAVAALTCAMAAGLVEMVCNLTMGKRRYERMTKELKDVKTKAARIKKKLLVLADADVAAFNQVMAAYKISKEEKGRVAKIQKALKRAADVPLEVAVYSNEVVKLAKIVSQKGNRMTLSDAKSAVYLGKAAKSAAFENVRINLKMVKDEKWKKRILEEIRKSEAIRHSDI